MRDELFPKKKQYVLRQKKHRKWKKIVSLLSCLVVFCTTYALILPAVTLDGQASVTCGLSEHQHSDSCYSSETTCGQEAGEGHTHTADCCTSVPTCNQTEHTHSDACYAKATSEDIESVGNDTNPAGGDTSSNPGQTGNDGSSDDAAAGTGSEDNKDNKDSEDGGESGTPKETEDDDTSEDPEAEETDLLPEGSDNLLNAPNLLSDNSGIMLASDETSDFSTITYTLSAGWDNASYTLSSLTFNDITNTEEKVYYSVQYSDDGTTWTTVSETAKDVDKKKTTTLLGTDGLANASLDRRFRIYASNKKDKEKDLKTGFSDAISLYDILNSVKDGFSKWLEGDYLTLFGGTTPTTTDELYSAFARYYSLPKLSIAVRAGTTVYVDAETDATGDALTYAWEYLDTADTSGGTEGTWKQLCDDTSATINATAIAEGETGLLKAPTKVRCKLYSDGEFQAVSDPIDVNASSLQYDEAISKINEALKLGDLGIGGEKFTKLFYYGSVAKDSRVPFNNAEEYKNYLAKLYLDNIGEDGSDKEALKLVEGEWNYYLYDLYDPHWSNLDHVMDGYPTTKDIGDKTVGDKGLSFTKDGTTSFHTTSENAPKIEKLNYNYLENGVDYSNFVSGVDKTATADAAGDANEERSYSVDITENVQAKAKAPVAMILQIQTSWQLFDMEHANAQKGASEGTEVGSVCKNTEQATLYDIKHALLRFVDYMEQNYSGNNLVLGVTEVKHGGSTTMLLGKDSSGNDLYVSNNADSLRGALLEWDSFGNCEHVHYDTKMLEAAVKNLKSNLSGWQDNNGHTMSYDSDIRKVAVIIGGATENTNGDNGYGCELPWSTFSSNKLNSVYSIRTNEGSSVSSDTKVISWLDNTANNTGDKFKDGTGTTFTDKYIATNEDKIYNYLVQIAEQEMEKNGFDVSAPNSFIENLTVSDTITDEFYLDTDEQITATVYDSEGNVESSQPLSLDDEDLTITKDEETGTTSITYNFGKVYNGRKCVLHFKIKAKDNYIGSNNVYTNVDTPATSYTHAKIDGNGNPTGEVETYNVKCYDTPEVNVPIRFDTVDGDETTIKVGESVDLADLSTEIAKDAEDRVDNYDQANGTLTYVWEMPDGTKATVGTVAVKNGSTGGVEFPSRSYFFTGVKEGQFPCTLKVTFTPSAVDTSSRNFSDDVTATAVNALTNDGIVRINVVDKNTKKNIQVKKVWAGLTPTGVDSIQFKVLANSAALKDDSGADKIYKVTAADNWTTEITDLPSVSEDGTILTYSVEEYEVPTGYEVGYSTESEVTDSYAAKVTLSVNPSEDVDKRMQITYRYNGQTYTYIAAKPSKKYDKNTTHTFTIDNLPVDENNKPYDVEIVSIYKLKDDGKLEDKEIKINSRSAAAESYVSGTTTEPIYVITNTCTADGYELPSTGGPGKFLFTFSGTCLIAGALVYRYHTRRRRERRAE